jgi:hypothetical protein
MPAIQGKYWCFTLNNYTEDEVREFEALLDERPGIDYLVVGVEQGEKEGTPHLQGFVAFSKKVTANKAKKIIGPRCHIERAKGTPVQAAEYCKKDGQFVESGVCPKGKGSRSDLVEIATKIKSGCGLRKIAEEHPASFMRYSTGIARLVSYSPVQRSEPPVIWVFWGKTGTGKTRRVYEFVDTNQLWKHPGDRWFDGYDQHPAVLFDDFCGSWFKLTYLLKLIDRYTMQVPVKGAYAWWNPKTIYFTSNQHPKDWYNNANEEHVNALMRRLNEFGTIQECTGYP